MNAPWKRFALALTIAIALAAGHVLADEKEDGPAFDPMNPQQGAEHELLKKFCGEWTTAGKYWMAPDQEPMGFDDRCVTKPIMNGWHVEMDFIGNMMGQPWRGRSTMSYDQVRGQYTNVWIVDNGSTVTVASGKTNDKGELILKSDDLNFMSMTVQPSETVMRWTGDDSYVMEMWWLGEDGKRTSKMMEIVYTRKE